MVSYIEMNDYIYNISWQLLVYLKALQYSMSESDHLNSTNNTGNTFISLDQASTIMADQTQGGNPQQIQEVDLDVRCGYAY